MKKRYYRVCKLLFITVFIVSASMLITGKTIMAEQSKIIVQEESKYYRLGRFSVKIPETMKQVVLRNKVYFTDIETFAWDNKINHKEERKKIWDERLQTITSLTLPDDVKEIVIDTMDFSSDEYWAKGVFYHGNSVSKKQAGWDVLVDRGEYGAWFRVSGSYEKNNKMIKVLNNVIKSYRASTNKIDIFETGQDSGYYLKYGMLDMDFKAQEKTYSRFEGHPIDQYLKLKVEIEAIDEVEETNLIQRLSISLLGNFAPGISIDEIRSEQREVGGLKGEEVVIRGTEEDDSNLIFSWRFPGEKDSATAPEILIKMDSKDGDLDAKLALWDSVLDSFKPLGH
ncbi:hypothetical protein MNBD_GAMMA21-133 [hydrothermal vent metagenome]|uniref:Tle cognate immunity protein 4 C-terminal domain-containing protein n=1 Tax=hydrothermal vent metagenome TaxID=652676 RepID=A0A3B1AIW6_9ZZZZ